MRAVLESRHWPAPKFRYSPLVAAGPFIKTAGMVGLDNATGRLVAGGGRAEARRILENLWGVMADLGLEVGHMVSATIYVAGFEIFPEINAVWDDFFSDDVAPPARTSVGVSALPLGAAVEMDFLFYAPAREGRALVDAEAACVSCDGCGACRGSELVEGLPS